MAPNVAVTDPVPAVPLPALDTVRAPLASTLARRRKRARRRVSMSTGSLPAPLPASPSSTSHGSADSVLPARTLPAPSRRRNSTPAAAWIHHHRTASTPPARAPAEVVDMAPATGTDLVASTDGDPMLVVDDDNGDSPNNSSLVALATPASPSASCANAATLDGATGRSASLLASDDLPPPPVAFLPRSFVYGGCADAAPAPLAATAPPFVKVLKRTWQFASRDSLDASHFSLLSFNVLAPTFDLLANAATTDPAGKHSLDPDTRRTAILDELLFYEPDMICLQEVDPTDYHLHFAPTLHAAGYAGHYAPKSAYDGCATFFRRDRFDLVHIHTLRFRDVPLHPHDPAHPYLARHVDEVTRHRSFYNLAQIAVLRNRRTGARVRVVNTHFLAAPEFADSKLLQAAILMEHLAGGPPPVALWPATPRVVAPLPHDEWPPLQSPTSPVTPQCSSAPPSPPPTPVEAPRVKSAPMPIPVPRGRRARRTSAAAVAAAATLPSPPAEGMLSCSPPSPPTGFAAPSARNRGRLPSTPVSPPPPPSAWPTLDWPGTAWSTAPAPAPMATVIAGDLNSCPDSSVLEYLQSGIVPVSAFGGSDFGRFTASGTACTHALGPLNSAYAGTKLPYTHCRPHFRGIIDHILYTGDAGLRLVGRLDGAPKDGIAYLERVAGLPSAYVPSDHLPLLAIFKHRGAGAGGGGGA
ncbi:Glucose-repressible alcohol dehydrogenase transcriptional effector [Allomyces arbusculus]|nr:Glucose-repressible alcohol dehydrogenase transcriptional effector [Allomyces arbusculus]